MNYAIEEIRVLHIPWPRCYSLLYEEISRNRSCMLHIFPKNLIRSSMVSWQAEDIYGMLYLASGHYHSENA